MTNHLNQMKIKPEFNLKYIPKLTLFFCLCVLFSVSGMAQSATPKSEKIIFRDVNVVTMNCNCILREQTVVIEDGIIKQIDKVGDIDIPDGIEVIEAKGSYLMPGLMDMHVHIFSEDELILYLINGVTTVRNLWGWEAHLKMKKDVESGKILGPEILTSGRIIDGKPAKLRGSAEIDNFLQVKEEVKNQVKDGYDFIKVYDLLEADIYSAIILEAQKYKIPVVGHVPKNVGLYSTFLAGQSSIEHLDGFLKVSTRDSVPSWSSQLDTTLLTYNTIVARDFNMWITPTLTVLERGDLSAAESEAFLSKPEIDYLPSFYKRFCCGSAYDIEDDLPIQERVLRLNNRLLVVKTLHKNGVKLLLGTDTGNRFVLPGFDIHSELENLVMAGFSPYEALKTGTINSAMYLGKLAEVGTIEEGKIADLILVGENPLENLNTIRKPIGVMARGKWIPDKYIQELLNKLEDKFKDD